MAGRGEGGEMRIKTEETLAPRLSTFHFPHENSRAGHVAGGNHRITIIYLFFQSSCC